MRFSYQIGMCEADHYLPLVQAAEAAGYHGITIPDSICYPQQASSKYPYNADGSREFLESVPFIESLIGVATMAAVTEKIRFSTFVYKLAIRQAAIVAKQVQSINRLSNTASILVWVSAPGRRISPWRKCPGKSGASAWMSRSRLSAAWILATILVIRANCTICHPAK